jgi:hypothetical protein
MSRHTFFFQGSISIIIILALFTVATRSLCRPVERIIFIEEPGFPTIECSPLSFEDVQSSGIGAEATVDQKGFEALRNTPLSPEQDLLIWPYGSAMCDAAWQPIAEFMEAGGNILVTGGRAFTVDVVRKDGRFEVVGFTNRFSEKLFIIDAEPVVFGQMTRTEWGRQFDHLEDLPPFAVRKAYSLLAGMSSREYYARDGSLASIDGQWTSMLAGVDGEGFRSIPLVSGFDRTAGRFAGGRWLFCTFDAGEGFWKTDAGIALLDQLLFEATHKPMALRVRPGYACYYPGEKAAVHIEIRAHYPKTEVFEGSMQILHEGKTVQKEKFGFTAGDTLKSFEVRRKLQKGLYHIDLSVTGGGMAVARSEGGFVVGTPGDMEYGEAFDVNSHFLTRGAKTFPIAGMTYMASDVHRYFFIHPNPSVWDRDMQQMRSYGINMLRTGIWTGHDYIIDASGVINEYSMRAFDAFFLIAKKHDLPVQFNFFHMMPSMAGSVAPYTDPKALDMQKKYILAFVERYKDNPDIIWDLINEPSYGKEGVVWLGNTPTGHSSELKLWNQWLKDKYGTDLDVLASKWNITLEALYDEEGNVRFPDKAHFGQRNLYAGDAKPLPVYDYNLFSNYAYNQWAGTIRAAIAGTGSRQLVVTGQDEGGVRNRVLTKFYAQESAFTTIHNWWSHDDLLWDNIAAKVIGKPLIIQETGNMRYTGLREHRRLSEQELAASLERKMAFGIGAEGGGFMPWIWNLNVYMTNENELFIGMHRGDGTVKEEVKVVHRMAQFVEDAAEGFGPASPPDVMLVLPLSLQLSAYTDHAQTGTAHAVRALHYYAGLPAISASEYHLDRVVARPKLAILPSASVLTEEAWNALLGWVEDGTTLLVTGPVDRDPHFMEAPRLAKFGIDAAPHAIVQHHTDLAVEGTAHAVDYYGRVPMANLDKMVWSIDHDKIKEITHGQGSILVTEYPLEMGNNLSTTAAVYTYAAEKAGVDAGFTVTNDNPGILVRPMRYENASLYLVISENADDTAIEITDKHTGKTFGFDVPRGRAQMLMISNDDGHAMATYGIESLKIH